MCPPKCSSCGLQVETADTLGHLASRTCRGLTAQRRQHEVAAASAAALKHSFTAYNDKLRRVEQFKYLGRVVSMDDNDVPAMRRNLKKARRTWGRLRKVLEKEEVSSKVAGMFYQGVVASQLLYGSETWVLPPSGLRALEGFHVEAARRLTGMKPKQVNGVWEYPHSADVLKAAGLTTIAETITKRRSNIAKTIEGRRVLKECREAERRRGSPPRIMWWDQELDSIEEGGGDGGLGFTLDRGGNDSGAAARVGSPAPPLRPPPREAVPWHHRSGPLGGGLNIMSTEEHAAQMAAMPRVHMPGEALPSL